MKINDPNVANLTSGLGHTQRIDEASQGKRASETTRARQFEDRVQLSSLAGSLQSLSVESEEREATIERLAVEYREGRYRHDPAATTRKLVADTLDRREK